MTAPSPTPVRRAKSLRLAPVALAVLGLAAFASGTLLATLLPALLLLGVLALGRFPGERMVLALAERTARPRRQRRSSRRPVSTGRRPHAAVPCGAALIAFHRAVRPPPALLNAR